MMLKLLFFVHFLLTALKWSDFPSHSLTSLLPSIFGLIGVLIGSVISYLSQRQANKSAKENLLLKREVDEYLATIDCSYNVIHRLSDLKKAVIYIDPNSPNLSAEEKAYIQEQDRRGVIAIEALFVAISDLQRMSYRITAIGDQRVLDISNNLNFIIDNYLTNQAFMDGRFVAADYDRTINELNNCINDLANIIKTCVYR